jgi:ATP-dependent helicase/nuclease subunit A
MSMTETPGQRVADQAERFEALDHTRSFIVQAPAGAGKTELLIQRFLTLLGKVEQPESVLALTFTRKAAGEMRHRVIDALRRASEPEPATSHEKFTWRLAERVVARDRELDWHLVEHPSRLRIQTIDSLCARLVRQMPWVSRMGSVPRPAENVQHFYRQAARALLELLESDLKSDSRRVAALQRLLVHLDNNVGTLETLLVSMLERRDQWLRHVVGNVDSELFRISLDQALEGIIANQVAAVAEGFPENLLGETLSVARFAAANLVEAESRSPLTVFFDRDTVPGSDADSLDCWLGLAEMFLNKGGERRKQLTLRQGFPPTKEGKEAKRRALRIELDAATIARLHLLRFLPPHGFTDIQWDVLESLMEVLPVAVAQLRLVFREAGRVDFTEVAHGSQTALGPADTPTDLAFALDCRIQHLLVDEFQDTSQSQYELITRLTREWQPVDGQTLFLVGDPMQSIYGFREAEVGLFLRARHEGVGNIRLTPLTLSVNFRSEAGIVDWVNEALGAAFPVVEDAFSGAVTYAPSVPFKASGPEPAVRVHPFFESDPEAEAGRVLEIIREAQSRNSEGTVAVLVRARSHLVAIVSALRRAGEKYRAVEIDALGERSVVQDLLALTRALLDPADRVAWLSILHAPWCGLTLADLETLVGGDFSSTMWDLVQDRQVLARISPDGRARLERMTDVLSEAVRWRGALAIRRWVEGVWIDLGGPACLESLTDLEDAAVYLDLLEESLDGLDLKDYEKFAGDVARLFARPDVEAGEALQLLTIHKAKGLEFDTVILPGLGRSTRSEARSLMMTLEYMDPEGATQLLLAPIQETGGVEDPLYSYLRSVDTTKRDHESTRLLYVASTRARESLHLLAAARLDASDEGIAVPGRRTLLGKIWQKVEPDFRDGLERLREMPAPSETSVVVGTEGVSLRRLALDWKPPPPPEDMVWQALDQVSEDNESAVRHPTFVWASELQRRVGIVVHRMLWQLQAPLSLDFSEASLRAALRSEGLDGPKLEEAVSRAVSALQNAVGDDRGRWILSGHDDDRREYALSSVVEGQVRHFVLDRTFVDGPTRWIIDYKTSTHEGGGREAFLDNEQERYRPQLENYASAMQHIDRRPIRLGLYFPLLQGWREWAFDNRGS